MVLQHIDTEERRKSELNSEFSKLEGHTRKMNTERSDDSLKILANMNSNPDSKLTPHSSAGKVNSRRGSSFSKPAKLSSKKSSEILSSSESENLSESGKSIKSKNSKRSQNSGNIKNTKKAEKRKSMKPKKDNTLNKFEIPAQQLNKVLEVDDEHLLGRLHYKFIFSSYIDSPNEKILYQKSASEQYPNNRSKII